MKFPVVLWNLRRRELFERLYSNFLLSMHTAYANIEERTSRRDAEQILRRLFCLPVKLEPELEVRYEP